MEIYCHIKMIRERKANQKTQKNADVLQRAKRPLWPVLWDKHNSEELLPVLVCVCSFLLLTRSWRAHSFYLVLSLFSSHCPSFIPSPPPLCLSQGIACMPGRWLKEPVRLSIQGFHLVIPHLGIHDTLLPPETSCLNTNLLKETSHCHFNSGSLLLASLLSFLHPFSTPSASLSTYFLLILFYVVFLPLPHPRDGRGRNTFFVFFQPLW